MEPYTFKRILTPLDGSENTAMVDSWVAEFARLMRAEVALVAVVDPSDVDRFNPDLMPVGSDEVAIADPAANLSSNETLAIERAEEMAKRYLKSQAQLLEPMGLKVSTWVSVGSPAEEINYQARVLGADLIAMSTRRGSRIARGILGSVTDRVLHTSPVPVMTVNPANIGAATRISGKPRTLIVPLDGSALCEAAVNPAIGIAVGSGAKMIFIQVEGQPNGSNDDHQNANLERNQTSCEYLNGFVELASTRSVSASIRSATGNPALRIIEESERAKDTLIVMTSHGASGLKRLILGSVADKVIRSSNRPVILVPPTPSRTEL